MVLKNGMIDVYFKEEIEWDLDNVEDKEVTLDPFE